MSLRKRAADRYDAWIVALTKRLSRDGLYEFLAAEYAKLPIGAAVLCVGAGGDIGRQLQSFAVEKRFAVTAFDADPGRKPDIVGDICDHDFNGKRFDAVVISEVLEHVAAPDRCLAAIRAALKPGGRLILTVPFCLPIHDRPQDYFRFTRHGLELLLRDFDTVEVRERNSYFEALDVLWVRLYQTGGIAARRFSRLLVPWIYYVKRPVSRLLGRLIRTDALTTGYVVTAVRR